MKTFLLISSLFILVACKSGPESTHSKECTLNGEPVDCKFFSDNVTEGGTPKVSISVPADIHPDRIEILANANDEITVDGLTCSTAVYAGQTIFYNKVSENQLNIEVGDGEQWSFTWDKNIKRWVNERSDGKVLMKMKISLENGVFSNILECSYI